MPDLSEVAFAAGQLLFEVGDKAENVYFPSSAVISVVTVMEDGRSAESHTIGRESGVGLVNAAGEVAVQSRVFAQVGGGALRLPAAALRRRLADSETLPGLMMRHVHASLLQAQQFTACNVLHPADQRLARWLLMTADRTGSASFPLTQEYMAVMTGVQRTTVSTLATGFKERGLIRYSGVMSRSSTTTGCAPRPANAPTSCTSSSWTWSSTLRPKAPGKPNLRSSPRSPRPASDRW
ncbi:Crp/Fnr family transcriptional regulator [soil metagenome]